MDREAKESKFGQSGSFGEGSSAASSLRRRSLCLSDAVSHQVDGDTLSESVSEAGDIGDRALHSNRYSGSGRLHVSADNVVENGIVSPIPEDALLQSYGVQSHDLAASITIAPVSPSMLERTSSLSAEAMAHSGDKNEVSHVLPYAG